MTRDIAYSPEQAQAIRGLAHLQHLVAVMAALVLLALLAGCAGAPQVQTVKVPIPIECRVAAPERPAMPTDALAPGFTLDRFVAAATAEIEIREGYELQLQVALASCTKPIAAEP